jgi:hypothetical protein
VLLFNGAEAFLIRKQNDTMDHYSNLAMERLSIKAARNKARLLAEIRRDHSVIDAIRRRRKHYLGPKSKSVWERIDDKLSKSQRRNRFERAKKSKA